MKWSVAARIATAFGLAIAVFLAVASASYRSTSELIAATQLRRHSYDVLDQLEQVLPLVREMELGDRNHALTGDEVHLQASRRAAERLPAVLQRLRALTSDHRRQQQRIATLEAAVRERIAESRDSIAVAQAQGQKAVVQRIRSGASQALDDAIVRELTALHQEERRLLNERADASDANAREATRTILLGSALALAVALVAGTLLARGMSRRLQQLTACAERIQAGDVSMTVEATRSSDEVGALARAFVGMIQYLQRMAAAAEQLAAGDLRGTVTPQSPQDALGNAFARMSGNLRTQMAALVEAANVLHASVGEIVASTSQLAASASQSAAAVAETTATVEQVRQTAELASDKARQVADSAQRAAQGSHSGRRSTEDVATGMERIRQQMEAIAASMGRLSEHGQTIGQIIATVEDLAAQSNLLAVNAAIEAAKAGEHGKGFAVVAQEVKHLAAQSRQATGEVRSILGDIQAATVVAVQATQQGGQAVESGTRQTEVASDAIRGLTGSIGEAAQAATQIAASSQQQLVGVKQVAGAMESVRVASSQNMESARQLEAAARNLNALGLRIKEIVASYHV
jgi:methyl-accepting chemotaxis protein